MELSVEAARAIALGRWRSSPRKFETGWDPSRPDELVARLREQLGPTRRIALAIGLGFLHLKHVSLPPAPAAERRRILALEPDRFFPVQGESLVISLADQENLAFAIEADLLERWIAAFEEWAPVELVEAAPLSVARVLRSGVSGSFAVPGGVDEHGLLELEAGRIRSVRRVPAESPAPAAQPLPDQDGVSGAFLPALGAARGIDSSLDAALLSDERVLRIRRNRVQQVALAAGVCAGALGLALWSLDFSREGALERIRQQVAAVTPRAARAVELRDRLAATDREAAAIVELARARPDPLPVLAALSEQLPADATVLNLRASGNEWQIDGTARDAAALVPLLDRDDRFEGVRFRSASSRFREGNRTYETFSIAFRVRPAS